MKTLEGLNPPQKEAVQHFEGPLLVLAGAGSGKTRVLTHRIAHLIKQHGIHPFHILAVTFTNKAADEMKSRVANLLKDDVRGLWIGTFHSINARLLRQEADKIGFTQNYVIYDTADSLSLIKKVMENLNMPLTRINPKAVRSRISSAKNSMIMPSEYFKLAENFFDENVAAIYDAYQRALSENNAMDFDDLLLKPVELMNKHQGVMDKWRERFQFILVDECQDTNRAQYAMMKLLAGMHKNIFIVGDDDQSIYGWRGADINNMLGFENDFPGAKLILLEQNYRSTKIILDAAVAVVKHNIDRKGKKLWTENETGRKLGLIATDDERDEARFVSEKILSEKSENGLIYKDFVVLYRTNAQSRALEEGMGKIGLPYIIVGGIRFYERKEIKDVLAYLKVLVNPADSISLMRALCVPKRGIGMTSIGHLLEYARTENSILYDAIKHCEKIDRLTPNVKKETKKFHLFMEEYREKIKEEQADIIIERLVDDTGIYQELVSEGTLEAEIRLDNIRELISAAAEFCSRSDQTDLASFLQEVSLVADIDRLDPNADAVRLMTMHNAKGLEFPVVFIAGLEEGLFPLSRSYEDPKELEEERRLFHVSITRAKKKVYMTYALNRRRWGGDFGSSEPSTFLDDIPSDLIEIEYSDEAPVADVFDEDAEKEYVYDYEIGSDVPVDEELGVPVISYDTGHNEPRYKKGERVKHHEFGGGTIMEVSGRGKEKKVTVLFDREGRKKLVVRYAKLEKEWE